MNGDPTKYPEWYKRFLRGVARVESAGGQLMMNPSSTATGLYGQLYSEVEDLPMLEGVSREEFAADTALQRKVMGERFEGNIPGIPGLMRNARELTAEYKPQLGEKFTFRPDEVAALTNYLGRQRTREYFASIRDDKPFEVPGKNKTPEDYLEEYNRGFEEEYRFGGKIKKKKQYQQGGLLAQKDPTLVPDPPEDPPSDDVLARLSLGITPPDQQFRLTGGDAPFRTIKQQKDVIAEQESEGDVMEILRYLPVTGEVIDAAELAKVFATGEDIYGEEQDPATFAAMTAAGYVIPNVLEKPLKSAWRAVKQFPAKMPKKEFRELPTESREAVLQNLTQAHEEVYGSQLGMTKATPEGEFYREVIPRNIRQLPSLMSGSKLENAVGKDGLIQVSQIENLINSKDISAVEREALEEVMQTEAFQTLREMGGGSKVDYNKFRNLTSGQTSIHNNMYVESSRDYADYGLDALDLDIAGHGRYSSGLYLPDIKEKARTNLIKHNQADLMSKEYGHFGQDVIGHYRTFERPDEKGVLYISELQADPLQARGSAGEKRVGLNVIPSIREDEVAGQISAIDRSIQEVNDLAERVSTMPTEELELFRSKKTGRGGHTSLEAERALPSLKDIKKDLVDNTSGGLGQGQPLLAGDFRRRETAIEELKAMRSSLKKAKEALEGGYRGGPNAKQANLIKNQDQFLISHILEQEAKGADKLRFPTGETTAKIQGYADQTQRISRAKSDVSLYENISKEARENELVDKTFKEHPMFKGKDEDEIFYMMEGFAKAASDPRIPTPGGAVAKIRDEFAQGFRNLGGNENTTRKAVFDWYDATKKLRSSREHLSRINASEQATQGIMKGYDRLPKALKKHGLDATKVTDDVGNTWWEVDIPARLGEGVGEIRAYRKGGQVSDKIRVLKKEGYPQKQAVAIALAMQQKGQL